MKIINSSWNRFIVPISREDEETEENYSQRVAGYITEFYKKYTNYEGAAQRHFMPFKDVPLENLTLESNFCSMSLDGIPYCDVKFFIMPEGIGNLPPGIDILCHRDDLRKRGPMIGFMRKKWREFNL